jgi:hypothetical protein
MLEEQALALCHSLEDRLRMVDNLLATLLQVPPEAQVLDCSQLTIEYPAHRDSVSLSRCEPVSQPPSVDALDPHLDKENGPRPRPSVRIYQQVLQRYSTRRLVDIGQHLFR